MNRTQTVRRSFYLFIAPITVTLLAPLLFPLLKTSIAYAITPQSVTSPYLYTFNNDGTLKEAGSATDSTSAYWWVNSGAYLKIYNGVGHTVQGALSATDPWRAIYAAANPVDTDNGLHPQNIFRLVSRNTWQNVREEGKFYINASNLSNSPNRNQSNGLLFFMRYVDHDNLYYVGIRVDGFAIIKKKQNGIYTTLAQEKIFPGTWNHDTNPNLLPEKQWMGLRGETTTNADGSVHIALYLDKNNTGSWSKIAEATDTSTPITQKAFGGIRTDFMDVSFENFKATSI